MDEHWPSRSQRSRYIWHLGVRQFGVLLGVAMLVTDIWRHRWPRVPIAFTSRFVVDAAFEILTIAIASIVAGALFGYLMWYFARWFLDVRD
jgi:NhaP-type Na+/H+ or K+/H+ antiporter